MICCLSVFLYAVIIDHSAPVQSVGEVIDVAVCVPVALHVARSVFKLLLDGLHVCWELHWKQTGRFELAAYDVKICLRLHTE